MTGALLVVGTGIQAAGQITVEARAAISGADQVFYLVGDPVAEAYLLTLNPCATCLAHHYQPGRERYETYVAMVEDVLDALRAGADVCAAFYGHPGIFVFPSREMIRGARKEGYCAKMLPGVSAEDCLFADLGVDPGIPGCQSFEATAFLHNRWRFDRRCSLILWQVGIIGSTCHETGLNDGAGLHQLATYLSETYGSDHQAVLYEAAIYPIFEPRTEHVSIRNLGGAQTGATTTLYVPPLE